jgi:hypothetical protein
MIDSIQRLNKSFPEQDLIFPIQLKKMSDQETKEYHLKKLFELSKPGKGELDFRVDGSIWKDGKLLAEEPSYEQKEWFNQRMRGSARTWETSIEHKPWILRWNYFILEDYQNG